MADARLADAGRDGHIVRQGGVPGLAPLDVEACSPRMWGKILAFRLGVGCAFNGPRECGVSVLES